MKVRTLLLISLAVLASASEGQKPLTEAEVKSAFDRALRLQDGRLLFSVLRSAERKGVTPQSCEKFLKAFVKPWYEGPSMMINGAGKRVNLNSTECKITIAFDPKGGERTQVVNNRQYVFETPTIKEGSGYKASVGFAQIIFAIGNAKANGPNRYIFEEMELSQKIVESYIPKIKAMGIKGSVDPETSQYKSWDQIVKDSRAEIVKYKAKYQKRGGLPN